MRGLLFAGELSVFSFYTRQEHLEAMGDCVSGEGEEEIFDDGRKRMA